MKKYEIIDTLINSPAWSGTKDKRILNKYSKQELLDIYNELEEAEQEYYNFLYY